MSVCDCLRIVNRERPNPSPTKLSGEIENLPNIPSDYSPTYNDSNSNRTKPKNDPRLWCRKCCLASSGVLRSSTPTKERPVRLRQSIPKLAGCTTVQRVFILTILLVLLGISIIKLRRATAGSRFPFSEYASSNHGVATALFSFSE